MVRRRLPAPLEELATVPQPPADNAGDAFVLPPDALRTRPLVLALRDPGPDAGCAAGPLPAAPTPSARQASVSATRARDVRGEGRVCVACSRE